MDQILKEAAETGNVSTLYGLIERGGNVLRLIDEVEFIDTPLHTAAGNGQIPFAMEMMNLKPSFARKLNHQGLSPLHVAVEKGQVKMALRLLRVDKDLVRVRGKNGETPFHYLIKVGNHNDLLDRFMEACSECIRDVTIRNRTALHIAVEYKRLDVLRVLIRSLRKKDHYEEVVNRQDRDGNTALHIAASNNQTEMLALLLECKADKHLRNHDKKSALDVARDSESISILGGCFSPGISNSIYELKKKTVNYVTKGSSLIFHDMDNISGDDRNAILVVLGLLLTATYAATLTPPGGIWQGNSNSDSDPFQKLGATVMTEIDFLYFYIPTYVVFLVSFFLTLALLKPFPRGFRTALEILLAFLAICFDRSISSIAPTLLASNIISIFSTIVVILMVIMFIAYHVSKFSVAIVAGWIFPFFLISEDVSINVPQGMFFFLFLYDEFWKGTILVVCYSLFDSVGVLVDSVYANFQFPLVIIGSWLSLHLCRFCIYKAVHSIL